MSLCETLQMGVDLFLLNPLVLLPDFQRQAAMTSGASFAAPVATPVQNGPTNDGEDILTSCSSAPVSCAG